ncbi:MAG: RidA family protein [Deltaproteobacteria bacterium]|jgi:2-iminobutanoate/2-iminopropanoate deaminase|nr:RidA family protein [Deltaproteobacteria bacterium]
MSRIPVSSAKAPAAVGPYVQGIIAGGLVFTAGQLPLDPATGHLAEGVAAQTRQCLENLKAILEAAGAGLDKVVKITVFLADMADFAVMNSVYAGYFPENPPARSTVGNLSMARGALVEMEAVAVAGLP